MTQIISIVVLPGHSYYLFYQNNEKHMFYLMFYLIELCLIGFFKFMSGITLRYCIH